MITKRQIVDIARAQLPEVVAAFNDASLEAQSAKPDLDRLAELLRDDRIDGFYHLSDLVEAYIKLQNATPHGDKEGV